MSTTSLELSLEPIDNATLATVCGAMDDNIRRVATAFSVSIKRRAGVLRFEGDAAPAQAAKRAVERFRYLAKQGKRDLTDDDIELTLAELKLPVADVAAEREAKATLAEAASAITLKVKRTDLMARTPMQLEYLQNIRDHDITFGIGPAGTGKTFLAVACAVDAFERDLIKRIVLVRPAVEAGERLGFLPGDLIQKVDPYLRPLYDALFELMGLEKTTKLMERGTIEVAPLAFMRGRTLNGAFIILDEAQNTTPEQMKMFLTRIGFGTKTVVTGDPTQNDLNKNQKSGLHDAQHVLRGVQGIAFTQFTSVDVVRHPLVQKIVNAYERQSARDNS
ncbi:MAG TPA: PhoH family protein [Casimicrobium sp.]|nr:PhoH family protein [Casimicrobium sp.]HPV22666.1 PhoH family protein [Casimicrobium sp.]